MKQPPLLILLVVIAFFFLLPFRAQAQHAFSYSSIDYDESTNIVSAYAQTNPDYSTLVYYGYPTVSSSIKDASGFVLASQTSQSGSVSFTAPGNGSDSYSLTSGHYMMSSFRGYNIYSQCNGQSYSSAYIDYYNYQNFEHTPSTLNFYFYYDNFGPGPNCAEQSAFRFLAGTIATVSRPTLNGLGDI